MTTVHISIASEYDPKLSRSRLPSDWNGTSIRRVGWQSDSFSSHGDQKQKQQATVYTSGLSEASSRSWTARMHVCTNKRLANSSSMQRPSKRNHARILWPANPMYCQSAICISSSLSYPSRSRPLIAQRQRVPAALGYPKHLSSSAN